MKYLLLFFLLSCSAFAQTTDNQYNLIPFPAQFSGQAGQFTLTSATRIVVSPAKDPAVRGVAQTIASQIKIANGLSLAVTPTTPALAKGAHIFFSLNKKLALGNEGYKLTITPQRVVVEAATPNGLFRPCGNSCPLVN